MMKRIAVAKVKTVYVIGAGFSAGLGYPLTANLLVEVWPKLRPDLQTRLGKVIEFHHPNFSPKKNISFPYSETLLTEIAVNLDMFGASRRVEGSFTRDELREIQDDFLTEIAQWFHSLYERHKARPG
jgi:hypothetical protein